jgi:hypothetical protein
VATIKQQLEQPQPRRVPQSRSEDSSALQHHIWSRCVAVRGVVGAGGFTH